MTFINTVSDYAPAVLAVIIIALCAFPMLFSRRRREIWGTLKLKSGETLELNHWENIVGRGGASDARIRNKAVSRNHAALIRDGGGGWRVTDLGSEGGTRLRGKPVTALTELKSGDTLSFNGVDAVFTEAPANDREPGSCARCIPALVLLTAFIAVCFFAVIGAVPEEYRGEALFGFASVAVLAWISMIIALSSGKSGFEPELIAFFLTSVGFTVIASSDPSVLYKETLCLASGVLLYWLMTLSLRSIRLVRALRWTAAVAAVAMLAINVAFARSLLGARNWLSIAGVSFQPSEFVKLAFVFVGAATLDRLFSRRNLILFALFSMFCVGSLAVIGDFGTSVVFFTAYLVIAFMRSGSFAAVILSLAGAGTAAFAVVASRPYISGRFATWGRAWEFANDGGYQQTRTMAAIASGGLTGLGPGQGWLKNIFAADTDMVFGVISEEMGLIIAVLCVISVLLLALFAARSVLRAKSTFYVIAACGAAAIMLTQLALNVFGSVDMLPFTGVTFPFVSKGGSSLIASWGLLSFIKAGDDA